MKKLKSILLAFVFLTVSLSQYSCIGSFHLTKNLYDWNKNEVGGKWGQELVFLAFIILPVYELALLADGIVLNSIEFWTGSNPLAMKQGETETKIVQHGDDVYQLTAQKNLIHVEIIGGENSGETGEFRFSEQEQTWSFKGNGLEYILEK
jgi:hypothetical protein